MTAPGVTPRALGAARARELKATPITPEQAAFLARLLLTGVPQDRSDECPEGMRQPGDEGNS
jgi:hypothetical protein